MANTTTLGATLLGAAIWFGWGRSWIFSRSPRKYGLFAFPWLAVALVILRLWDLLPTPLATITWPRDTLALAAVLHGVAALMFRAPWWVYPRWFRELYAQMDLDRLDYPAVKRKHRHWHRRR